MGRIVVTEFVSLAGVMEDPGGSEHSKYVASSKLKKADWNNSTILKGDVVDEVSKLKQKVPGDILVSGSAKLVQTLIANDLVDQLNLMVFPVILGSGKRLFGETKDLKTLQLAESKTVGDGVAILVYKPAGKN